jgi:hypothetical protein
MKGIEVRRRRGWVSDNAKVRVEMQTFVQALASYADHVAKEPKTTFEEYHVRLMTPVSGAGLRPVAKAAAQGR